MFRFSPIARGNRRAMLSVLSGVLMALAFPTRPDHSFAFLFSSAWAFVALMPLMLALMDSSRSQAMRAGWLAGFVFNLVGLYWIAFTQGGGPAVIAGTGLMATYLGLYWGLCTLALAAMMERWGSRTLLAAPAVWTASEYVLSLGELGFPWMILGHSQGGSPVAIQHAEFTGVYGVSFWIVSINALLFMLLANRNAVPGWLSSVVLVPVVGGPLLYGWTVLSGPNRAPDGDGVVVGLVQNNMGLSKWGPRGLERSFESLERLSTAVAANQASALDLIVWPETALPCYVTLRPECHSRMQQLVATLGTPILAGASDMELSTREPYNAAFLFPDGNSAPTAYAKMHLVPFGERTPFRDSIPFLKSIDWTALTGDLGPAEFARGRRRTIFELPNSASPFSVLICFESVFPDFVRRSVAGGAEFLVNITNDSWFGRTAGPYQHAQLTAMRAVENRRAIARCATSGISLFVDPYGRTFDRTPIFTAAVARRELPRSRALTFYTLHGDWFPQLNAIVTAVLCVLLAVRARDKLWR